MLQWMVYVFVVTVILAVAALSAERALRLHRSMARWVWAAAIIASLVVPTLIASVSIQLPSITRPTAPQKPIALRNATSLPLPLLTRIPVPPPGSRRGATLDSQVERYWLAASSVMLLLIAASAVQLYWRRRRWERAVIAGVSVYVAPGVGPAVVGLLRPRIVLPPWVVEATPSLQADVIAHEQAHLAARDPQLLTVALCLLVFMPWNLPLWWQLHRLRRAIEVDCDARVLRAGRDVVCYGETLVEVGARQSGFIGAVAAMSESRSFLEQRIKIMLRKPNGWWKTSATLLGCMAVCLIAVAAQVSPPNSGTSDDQAQQVAAVDPAVYDGYVGHYKFTDTSVMTVSRDGSRLLTQLSGQPQVEVFPSSNTEYFYKIVKAQLTFQADAQGHATALTLHQNGMTFNAPRITDQAAQQIEDAVTARVQSQTANPGSEAALRKLYESLLAGTPDYDDMGPRLAQATRQQLPRLEEGAKRLGPIVSVDFRGVGNQGWDVYELHHEHGMSNWRILLSADGKVEGALFQGGP
jgi:hypothetical protein